MQRMNDQVTTLGHTWCLEYKMPVEWVGIIMFPTLRAMVFNAV